MHGQHRFDAISRGVTEASPATPVLILDRDLRIRATSSAYERATLREHDELFGQFLFDAFPDDPHDPEANGTSNLAASLEIAMHTGATHNMWIQRYDIPDPDDPDTFLPKVWSPTNSPLFDGDELMGVIHCVEEIFELKQVLAVMARAFEGDDSWSCAELMHTLAAVNAVENARHVERQQVLATENEQLRHAIETRDTIGQAKGIVMERFNLDANAAFNLLKRLSQSTNTRVTEVSRKLIEADHPPRSR